MRTITNEKTKIKNVGKPYSNIMPTWRDTARTQTDFQFFDWK